MADSTLDKSQPATPHRRQEARRQGHVARSSDLASAGLLLAGLAILLVLGQQLVQFFFALTHEQLGDAWLEADRAFILGHSYAVLLELAKVAAPMLGLLLATGVLVHILQTGLLWLPEKLAPDFDRINPLSGFSRVFSFATAIRLAMGLAKLLVVSLVACWTLYERRDEILNVAGLDLPQLASFIIDILLWTTVKIALALLALAAADYLYQRFRHERDLQMTPQEAREETKSLQGDPQLAARRRQAHRQTALARISKATEPR